MSRRPAFARTSQPARRHWAAWLVVAMLWAQGLGVWHHTVHAPGLKPARAEAQAEARGAAWSSPLHHAANSADCRLLDQLLLADGLATPALLPVVPLPLGTVQPGAPIARPALAAAQPYQARAPPTLG